MTTVQPPPVGLAIHTRVSVAWYRAHNRNHDMPQVLIAGSYAAGTLNEMPLTLDALCDFIEIEISDRHGGRWRMLYLRSGKASVGGLPVYEYSRHLPDHASTLECCRSGVGR